MKEVKRGISDCEVRVGTYIIIPDHMGGDGAGFKLVQKLLHPLSIISLISGGYPPVQPPKVKQTCWPDEEPIAEGPRWVRNGKAPLHVGGLQKTNELQSPTNGNRRH